MVKPIKNASLLALRKPKEDASLDILYILDLPLAVVQCRNLHRLLAEI